MGSVSWFWLYDDLHIAVHSLQKTQQAIRGYISKPAPDETPLKSAATVSPKPFRCTVMDGKSNAVACTNSQWLLEEQLARYTHRS